MKSRNKSESGGPATAVVAEPDSTPKTKANNKAVSNAAESVSDDVSRNISATAEMTPEGKSQIERKARERLESSEITAPVEFIHPLTDEKIKLRRTKKQKGAIA
jgi:hypothetical protein